MSLPDTLYVTRYNTIYSTRYNTSFVGVVTKYYRLEETVDEEGNKIIVTKIIDTVTIPFEKPGSKHAVKPVDITGLKKALKKIVLAK